MINQTSAYKKISLLFLLFFSLTHVLTASTCIFTNGGGDNDWHNVANWDCGVIPDSDDDAVVNNSTVNIASAITVNSLSINGSSVVSFTHNSGWSTIGDLTLSGGSMSAAKNIEVLNSFNWTGTSIITSSFNMELAPTCTSLISGIGNRSLYGYLINYGACTHTGGSLRLQSGAIFQNEGTYTFDGASQVIGTSGDKFSNSGVVNKNYTNELSFFTHLEQVSNGAFNVNAGTLNLLWGGEHLGNASINVASDATVKFSSGTYVFGANNTVSGSGNIEYLGATITGSGAFDMDGETKISSGTVNFNKSSTTLGTLTLSGGTIQGSSQIVVTDQLNWSGTSNISISDTLKIANTATALIFNSGLKRLYTTFVNEGSISHSAGDLYFYSGASIVNNGVYTLSGLSNIKDSGGGAFENNGSLINEKSGTTIIDPEVNNNVNGVIKGKGTLAFNNWNNNGTLASDASYGTLNITGIFSNGIALDIEFDDASHGEVVVSSDIVLSGSLDVNVIGTIPSGTYPILSTTSGTISGSFDTENLPSGFSIQYTSNTVSLMSGLLPVELISFDAHRQRNDVKLTWQTASEFNSDLFIIEHSPDGQDFIAIGEVQSVGYSNSIQDYQFTHTAPRNGINYYRLRQQDLDSSYEYSDLRYVNFFNFDQDITIYPNPSFGNVVIKNQSDKELDVTIRDLNGKVVYVRKAVLPGATALDLTALPKAIYTLEFKDDTYFKHIEKIVLQE